MNLLTVSFSADKSNAPFVDERTFSKAEYVYYDVDNLFPQKLIRLADNCPIHSAAIKKHAHFIAGNGLEFDDDSQADKALQYLEEKTKGVQRLLAATALDRAYFDGHSWAMQYTKGGDLLTVKHIDFSTLRTGKQLENDTPVELWYSSDWKYATNRRTFAEKFLNVKPKPYKNFYTAEIKRGVLINYNKAYKPGKIYYPEPEYIGALKYIETEIRLSQYIDVLTQKGFRAGTHIHLFKELDEDAAKKAEKQINDKFANADAPDIILTYGGDPSAIPVINNMPTFTNAEIVKTIGHELDKKIDAAHSIPAMLYTSFETATGLDGQSRAIREVLEYYQNTSVVPQQMAIESDLNEILRLAGFTTKCKIKASNPVNFAIDSNLMAEVLTRDEIRVEIGWPELGDERGKEIPSKIRRNVPRKDEDNNTGAA